MHAVRAAKRDDLARAVAWPLEATAAVRQPKIKYLAASRQRRALPPATGSSARSAILLHRPCPRSSPSPSPSPIHAFDQFVQAPSELAVAPVAGVARPRGRGLTPVAPGGRQRGATPDDPDHQNRQCPHTIATYSCRPAPHDLSRCRTISGAASPRGHSRRRTTTARNRLENRPSLTAACRHRSRSRTMDWNESAIAVSAPGEQERSHAA